MVAKNKTKNKTKKEPDKGGRPTKLTPEVVENFTAAVSIGSTYKLSAMYAKVSEEVVRHWMREGRRENERREAGEKPNKKNEPYLTFLMAVRDAEADAGIEWQKVLNQSAKADPNFALKMLRLRFGQGYVENDVTSNIEIPNDLPNEYLDRIIAGENPLEVIGDYRANKSASDETATAKGK